MILREKIQNFFVTSTTFVISVLIVALIIASLVCLIAVLLAAIKFLFGI